ncbi:MAG: DUF1285 domain-containing protein [Syntrophales bacterium]
MIGIGQQPDIRIDAQGVWYFRGEEMKRRDIVQYLYRYLKKDGTGGYCIETEHERCAVKVEDVPYVINDVDLDFSQQNGKPCVLLSLSDGSREAMSLDAPFWTGCDHVVYCSVKGGEFAARFSRPAYYRLCSHIEYDSLRDSYVLTCDNRSYPLVLNNGEWRFQC